MARRSHRQGAAPRARRRLRWLLALIGLVAAVWFAPDVIVRTPLRDKPLEWIFAGIDGSVTSAGATWRWVGGVEFHDVMLRDREGRAVALVRRIALDRGILGLAVRPQAIGTVRLVDPEVIVEVRTNGSSLEDILAPWLAAATDPVALELEVIGGTVELVDTSRHDAWRLSDVLAVGTLAADGSWSGWTAAGRLRHSEGAHAAEIVTPPPAGEADPSGPVQLDRATIPAAASAMVARDGGWSIASPPSADASARTFTVATHRLPLGVSSVLATRFGLSHILDGIADLRLDVSGSPQGRHLEGTAALEQFAVCDAAGLEERLAIDRCTIPFDMTLGSERVVVRRLEATSPVVRAEATGSIGLAAAQGGWLEAVVADDFSGSIDIDLAAAATALPHGIVVRRGVRITGGSLRLAAASRGDGGDRVVEVRASAADVEAERAGTDGTEGERIAWKEPLTAWMTARRGPGGGAPLVLEEARISSSAAEISASGTPTAIAVQWDADLGAVAESVAAVFETGDATVRGHCRGRFDASGAGHGTAVQSLVLAASLSDVELTVPGRMTWSDAQLAIEAEADGRFSTGIAAVERARCVVASGDDRLEATLDGGAVVDLMALIGLSTATNVPRIRPAANATDVTAECSLVGDLARWYPRLAAVVPGVGSPGLEVAGRVTAAATMSPRGDVWQWPRAGAEIDKLVVRWKGREITEPRVVIATAGRADAVTGQVDLSSGELLTTSISVRTVGLSWIPPTTASTDLLDRLRGRVQWQADIGRAEPWFVPVDARARWPATGRAWGTCEIVDTQAGLNLLVEATGSQLVLATAPGGRPGEQPRPVWGEPRLLATLEVTRPRTAAGIENAVRIDRLAVESSTLAIAASGRIDDWSSRRMLDLGGTVAYDWQQVSRLIAPWTGGQVQLTGGGGRPFALRGQLAESSPRAAEAPHQPATAAVPLPEGWLAATRGADDERRLSAQVTRPVKATNPLVDERLASLAIDTSIGWTSGEIEGVSLAAGEVAARLLEGQLAFGPFDLAVAGGRVRGAPWIRFVPWPGELVIPPGRLVERVAISGPVSRRIAVALSPLLGRAAQASGVMSIDLAGARLPMGDALGGELAGQVLFENFEVMPAAETQPLANLLVKLQSVVDPRFAFGDKAVLLRVRPDPIRVQLAGRRIYHEGLVMDSGQLVVRSQGSAGEDGTLDMQLEVAFRGDLVGQTPVIGQLFRTPLIVPLKGTVSRPQFDAAAMDRILGRIVENTAEAVVRDGIGRGLEAIFRPSQATEPAVPAAPPLTLPAQR